MSQFANEPSLDFDDVLDKGPTQEFEVAVGREVGEYAVRHVFVLSGRTPRTRLNTRHQQGDKIHQCDLRDLIHPVKSRSRVNTRVLYRIPRTLGSSTFESNIMSLDCFHRSYVTPSERIIPL